MKKIILAVFLCMPFISQTESVWDLRPRLIVLRLWIDLAPVAGVDEEHPLSSETAINHMLEEARQILAAMIYGYEFTYTPQDAKRGVEDTFKIKTLHEIRWGDPRLRVINTYRENDKFFAELNFQTTELETKRLMSWQSNVYPEYTGTGKASLLDGYTAKIQSLYDAVRAAVRTCAREKTFDKPRQITGTAILSGEPRTIIEEGNYLTQVRVKVAVKEILPYTIY